MEPVFLAEKEEALTALAEELPLVCGIDVVELDRFSRVLRVGGRQFLQRVYTCSELTFCADRLPQLAVRFAAKEAVAKALGTGLRGIDWKEIEICSNLSGRPFVLLYGHAATHAKQMQLSSWAVSLSHSPHLAIAYVIALRGQNMSHRMESS